MNKLSYDEFLLRMGYFRNLKNFSMRDLSLKLNKSDSYIKRIEDNTHNITVSKFFEWLELLDLTPQDFFYLGKDYSKEDKNLLEMFSSLTPENKVIIVDLMKKLNKN